MGVSHHFYASYSMSHTVWVIHYWSWAVNEYFRDIIGNFSLGFAFPCALYLGANLINGVPEGPYYYDAETFQPEEWEYYENPLARLFYKYVVPSTSVSHQLEAYLAPFPTENRFERVASLNQALSGYKEGKLIVPNLLPKRIISGKQVTFGHFQCYFLSGKNMGKWSFGSKMYFSPADWGQSIYPSYIPKVSVL